MDNKKGIILVCILIIIFIIICAIELFNKDSRNINIESQEIIYDEESKTEDLEADYKDITVYKEDGTEEKISDYKNMPIMILFWNEKSEDSVKVLKKVNELYSKYENRIKFFMIDTSDKVDDNIKNEISIDIYYDLDKEAINEYRIKKYPSMIYIDKNNEVFNAKTGFTTTDALEANLDILSENF